MAVKKRRRKSKKLNEFAAYHGGSWQGRKADHSTDCQKGLHWDFGGLNSEYKPLHEVLILKPSSSPITVANAERAQFLRPVDWQTLKHETTNLTRVLKKFGVEVRRLNADWFASPKPNLMFVRDHLFMTPWGAIVGRMASKIRAGEEKWAQKALADAGIPILKLIDGKATFEGADALWLNPQTVLVGIGNRTNEHGFRQIKKLLAEYDVKVFAVSLPKSVQHLLGMLQLVGPKTALLRDTKASKGLRKRLTSHGYDVIKVAETDEVTKQQGMNVLTLKPKKIIMPAGCPDLKQLYEANGITVLAEVKIEQMTNAAGGIACATSPLSRKLI